MSDLESRVASAVRQFWKTRQQQERKQGAASGKRDQGSRSAVTGGAQLDGFIMVSELLIESGIPDGTIFRRKHVELRGFFRPTKEWDLLVVESVSMMPPAFFCRTVSVGRGVSIANPLLSSVSRTLSHR